ncbi:MAG: hypothetical protein I4O51_09495, partial [Flavobacterium micromati]|nr:hypothetical protein [Flavobacterium micromati]
MKKIILIITLFILSINTVFSQETLCASTATNFCCEYVQSVTLNGVTYQGNTGFSGPGYYDYKNVSVPVLQANTTVPLSVVVRTNGPYQQFVKLWIDFNKNGNLEDAGELVYDETQMINSTTYTFNGNITVPPTAYNGPVNMRLIMVYNSTPTLCGDYDYGNTFDFSSTVQGGVNPVNLTVSKTGTGNVLSNPVGINTANNFNTSTFAENSSVILTATATAPQTFTGWSGDATGTTNPLPVTMNQAKNITANFGTSTIPSLTNSTIVASLTSIEANGVATSAITVQLKDSNNVNLTNSGGNVIISTTAGSLGTVVDNNDGTYTVTLTSSTSAATA